MRVYHHVAASLVAYALDPDDFPRAGGHILTPRDCMRVPASPNRPC
jgi:hypothetical protein